MRRLGVIMHPSGDPQEEMGTINPGGVTGPDGEFYLFPRLVAEGNCSRIGVARVVRREDGSPKGVERLGIALEPGSSAADCWGVEDPRVVWLEPWNCYAMTYTAFGVTGPRAGMATSKNLIDWDKHGHIPFDERDFEGRDIFGQALRMRDVDNKDALFLPRPVMAPNGEWSIGLIHRPDFRDGTPPSIWISYYPVDFRHGYGWGQHTLLMSPRHPWEAEKIGAGCVVETERGYLLFYHGVQKIGAALKLDRDYLVSPDGTQQIAACGAWGERDWADHFAYCAGAVLLDKSDPRKIVCRTDKPILTPTTAYETSGTVSNVVFPTAAEMRNGAIDLYYGAADYVTACAHITPIAQRGALVA